jgi:hypothetical protein
VVNGFLFVTILAVCTVFVWGAIFSVKQLL